MKSIGLIYATSLTTSYTSYPKGQGEAGEELTVDK